MTLLILALLHAASLGFIVGFILGHRRGIKQALDAIEGKRGGL